MDGSGDELRDMDALLHVAGERWRDDQEFELVEFDHRRVLSEAIVRSRVPALGGLGLFVIVATLVSIRLLLPQHDGTALWPSFDASGSLQGAASLVPTAIAVPGVDHEAAQLSVIDAVNTDRMNFGGVYLDDAGALVIQYVGANAGRAAVEARLTPEVVVRWERVERNADTLYNMVTEIRQSKLAGVVWIAIDTIQNRVEVRVGPSGSAAEVRADLEARYGQDALASKLPRMYPS